MASANSDGVYEKGMVFGVFDRLHEGHQHFLSDASSKCRELTVVVTLPEMVSLLKGRQPKQSWEERVAALRAFNPKLNVVPGDSVAGAWSVITTYMPDMIFLGHDQQAIADELRRIDKLFVFLERHR